MDCSCLLLRKFQVCRFSPATDSFSVLSSCWARYGMFQTPWPLTQTGILYGGFQAFLTSGNCTPSNVFDCSRSEFGCSVLILLKTAFEGLPSLADGEESRTRCWSVKSSRSLGDTPLCVAVPRGARAPAHSRCPPTRQLGSIWTNCC